MTDNQMLPLPQGPEYAPCGGCGHIEPEHREDAGACLLCRCRVYRPAAVSAVVAPPTDQAALREAVAEARDRLRGMALSLATGEGPLVAPDEFRAALDEFETAARSVVPPEPADQAAEVAKHVTRAIFALKSPAPAGSEHYRSGWDDGLEAAIDAARDEVLRRMADETATTEVVPCMRPEPHPAHSHSGLRKGTAVHGRCPGVPAAGARQDGAQQ